MVDLDPIIRPRQLPAVVGLSKATVYRMIARGEFPDSIALSTQARGWRKSTIERWLTLREAGVAWSAFQGFMTSLKGNATVVNQDEAVAQLLESQQA